MKKSFFRALFRTSVARPLGSRGKQAVKEQIISGYVWHQPDVQVSLVHEKTFLWQVSCTSQPGKGGKPSFSRGLIAKRPMQVKNTVQARFVQSCRTDAGIPSHG
jgi:hypothetical protein